jgi:hypothetical protein
MTEQVRPESAWRKSTYSGASGNGDCVEVALSPGSAAVRDTKTPATGTLAFPAPAWRALIASL